MKKIIPIIILLVLLALVWAFISSKNKRVQKSAQDQTPTPTIESKPVDEALGNALNLYSQKKSKGEDLSNGPCLGLVAPDWVADIAHNPRQNVDDKPENQCEDFRQGKAHHFIELDPAGNLIRAI